MAKNQNTFFNLDALKKSVQQRVIIPLEVKYQFLEGVIGQGASSTVYLAIDKATQEKVAIKIIDKRKEGLILPRLLREIKILERLNHPHVVKLKEMIETEHKIYVILEYCPGGELFEYVIGKHHLGEVEAREFFRQMVSAVGYCHLNGVCHRDLKLENMLLTEDKKVLKVIDFGLGRAVSTSDLTGNETQEMGPLFTTHCGTLNYAAPELLVDAPYYGHMVDVWSLGVVLYAICVGKFPFKDVPGHRSMTESIINCIYDMPAHMSPEWQDLIRGMLERDPVKRLSMDNITAHPWVNKGYDSPPRFSNGVLLSAVSHKRAKSLTDTPPSHWGNTVLMPPSTTVNASSTATTITTVDTIDTTSTITIPVPPTDTASPSKSTVSHTISK